jgi:hypothetical protein
MQHNEAIAKVTLKGQIIVMCINNVTTNSTQTLGRKTHTIYNFRCSINENKFIAI